MPASQGGTSSDAHDRSGPVGCDQEGGDREGVNTMRLYLVQHGEAKSEDEDPERPLTDGGAREVRRVADVAGRAGVVTVGRIVHSGKTRARQTAEAWGETFGVAADEVEGLSARDDPSIWATQVASEQADVMLVGHLPHLARLTGLLVAGDAERPVVAFQHAGLVGLQRDATGWSVFLVLPPGVV